jgi:hypothetical protein
VVGPVALREKPSSTLSTLFTIIEKTFAGVTNVGGKLSVLCNDIETDVIENVITNFKRERIP